HEREVERAAEALVPRAAGLDGSGRPLAAANGALDFPDKPVERLWHATTLLREHRGDGHVAALVAAGLDGCEALVLRSAMDLLRTELQPHRGWTDQEWEAATRRLTDRGLLAPDGAATEAAHELLRTAETATDRAAERPWRPLGPEEVTALVRLLTPLATACATALRFPNPIGLPKPTG
ncbi:hypothetical protein GTZ89_30335, partial [Streptomyces sp. SID8382]|nr:hypothetical protein [Streptomyces sp. SID8382]